MMHKLYRERERVNIKLNDAQALQYQRREEEGGGREEGGEVSIETTKEMKYQAMSMERGKWGHGGVGKEGRELYRHWRGGERGERRD